LQPSFHHPIAKNVAQGLGVALYNYTAKFDGLADIISTAIGTNELIYQYSRVDFLAA